MIMKIFSSFGEHVCQPGILQEIDNPEILQAEEEINSTVTADNQEESQSASDSC